MYVYLVQANEQVVIHNDDALYEFHTKNDQKIAQHEQRQRMVSDEKRKRRNVDLSTRYYDALKALSKAKYELSLLDSDTERYAYIESRIKNILQPNFDYLQLMMEYEILEKKLTDKERLLFLSGSQMSSEDRDNMIQEIDSLRTQLSVFRDQLVA